MGVRNGDSILTCAETAGSIHHFLSTTRSGLEFTQYSRERQAYPVAENSNNLVSFLSCVGRFLLGKDASGHACLLHLGDPRFDPEEKCVAPLQSTLCNADRLSQGKARRYQTRQRPRNEGHKGYGDRLATATRCGCRSSVPLRAAEYAQPPAGPRLCSQRYSTSVRRQQASGHENLPALGAP